MTPSASRAAGHTSLPSPQLPARGGAGHPSQHPPFSQGEATGNRRLCGAGRRERGGFSAPADAWPARHRRCSSPCFAAGEGQGCSLLVLPESAGSARICQFRPNLPVPPEFAGSARIFWFCLNLPVLPEFAALRPLLGPSRIVPAASFKRPSVASKGDFSGSDAREFPPPEAALPFGLYEPLPAPPCSAALCGSCFFFFFFFLFVWGFFFACPFKQSGDPEPSIPPPAARGEGSPPRQVIYLRG